MDLGFLLLLIKLILLCGNLLYWGTKIVTVQILIQWCFLIIYLFLLPR